MDVTKVRCDECGNLKPVHRQHTMTRTKEARSLWATPASTYIWTCCYECWTAQSHTIDVRMLRTIALQLRKHGEASPFRWNAAKINEAADLCLQMAEELEQREDPEDERDTKLK
jgi:hypothetical protein